MDNSFSSSGEYFLKSTYAALPFLKYNPIYNGLFKKIHTIHYKQNSNKYATKKTGNFHEQSIKVITDQYLQD